VNVQVAGVVAATLPADARLVRGIPTIAPPVEVARPSARPPMADILLLGIAMSRATLAARAASN
jgi:hypothetical protein